jgi:predicted oxidoreductase (fatty acid repression mutant protein)
MITITIITQAQAQEEQYSLLTFCTAVNVHHQLVSGLEVQLNLPQAAINSNTWQASTQLNMPLWNTLHSHTPGQHLQRYSSQCTSQCATIHHHTSCQ